MLILFNRLLLAVRLTTPLKYVSKHKSSRTAQSSRDKTFCASTSRSLLTDINHWNTFTLVFKLTVRSSHQRCSVKKDVLRNISKFTGKHLCQSSSFNKVAGLRPAPLLKERLWYRSFTVNFAKSLRTPF